MTNKELARDLKRDRNDLITLYTVCIIRGQITPKPGNSLYRVKGNGANTKQL